MPTLKEALTASRKGFVPVEVNEDGYPKPPVPQSEMDEVVRHPLMRTPVPTPIVTEDALRAFNIGDRVPRRRMFSPEEALGSTTPSSATSTTTATIVTSGGSSSSSSSTGSSGGSNTVVAQQTTIDTPLLVTGQQFFGTIAMAQCFAVLNCTVTQVARVQLYSTNAFQIADAGRGQTPPAGTTQHGVIMDLYLNTPDKLAWVMSPIAEGANQDDPQVDYAYLTVTNLGPAGVISVTITFVPEET